MIVTVLCLSFVNFDGFTVCEEDDTTVSAECHTLCMCLCAPRHLHGFLPMMLRVSPNQDGDRRLRVTLACLINDHNLLSPAGCSESRRSLTAGPSLVSLTASPRNKGGACGARTLLANGTRCLHPHPFFDARQQCADSSVSEVDSCSRYVSLFEEPSSHDAVSHLRQRSLGWWLCDT